MHHYGNENPQPRLEFGREVHSKVKFISTSQIVFPLQINYWCKRDSRYRMFQNNDFDPHSDKSSEINKRDQWGESHLSCSQFKYPASGNRKITEWNAFYLRREQYGWFVKTTVHFLWIPRVHNRGNKGTSSNTWSYFEQRWRCLWHSHISSVGSRNSE